MFLFNPHQSDVSSFSNLATALNPDDVGSTFPPIPAKHLCASLRNITYASLLNGVFVSPFPLTLNPAIFELPVTVRCSATSSVTLTNLASKAAVTISSALINVVLILPPTMMVSLAAAFFSKSAKFVYPKSFAMVFFALSTAALAVLRTESEYPFSVS